MRIILRSGHIIDLPNGEAELFEEQFKAIKENPDSPEFIQFWNNLVRIRDISAFENC